MAKGKYIKKKYKLDLKAPMEKASTPSSLGLTRNGNQFTLTFKAPDTKPASNYNNNAFTVRLWAIGSDGNRYDDHFAGGNNGKCNFTIRPSDGTYSVTMKVNYGLFYPNTSVRLAKVYMAVSADALNYTTTKTETIYTAPYVSYPFEISSAVLYTKAARNSYINGGNNVFQWTVTTTRKYYFDRSDSAQKEFVIAPPAKPSVGINNDGINSATAVWQYSDDNQATNSYPYTRLHHRCYVTKLSNHSTYAGSTNYTFATPTSGSQSFNIPMDNDAYLVRVYAYSAGPGGDSATTSAYLVYSKPLAPAISLRGTPSVASSNFFAPLNVVTNWAKDAIEGGIFSRPLNADGMTVKYCAVTPGPGGAVPVISSTQDVGSFDVKEGTKVYDAQFSPGDLTDKAVYMFTTANYNGRTTDSNVILVGWGRLSTPTITQVAYDTTTQEAAVTVTNNASSVPDSCVDVYFHSNSRPRGVLLDTIAHGGTQAFVYLGSMINEDGKYFTAIARTTSVYTTAQSKISGRMTSVSSAASGGIIPPIPIVHSVVRSGEIQDGKVDALITFQGVGNKKFTEIEIVWSDQNNFLNRNDSPNSWTLATSNDKTRFTRIISSLDIGKIWGFAARETLTIDNLTASGAYSSPVYLDLRTPPTVVDLHVEDDFVEIKGGSTYLKWDYFCEDGSVLDCSTIRLASAAGKNFTLGAVIATVKDGAQYFEISPEELRWTEDTSYYLTVQVSSVNTKISAWSDAVEVRVVHMPEAHITSTSLVEEQEEYGTDDEIPEGLPEYISKWMLPALPLTVNVTGAYEGGTSAVYIRRHGSYILPRPDDSVFHGNDGETMVIKSRSGDGAIVIEQADLFMHLDDHAEYEIVATITEKDGRSATSEPWIFHVNWTHQAVIPSGFVVYDSANLVARIITDIPEESYLDTDVCDIYRLSIDKPELIVENGIIGESYVDLYPVFAKIGGYRIVYKTQFGDYIAEGAKPTWIDLNNEDFNMPDVWGVIIDFEGRQVVLKYDISLSNDWSKAFSTQKYLGGSILGDWNYGVEKTSSVSTVSIVEEDLEVIRNMRRLAEYAGVCHVRTPDGSSFFADIQVSENRDERQINKLASFDLSITRIDNVNDDSELYSDYIKHADPVQLPVDNHEEFSFPYTSVDEVIELEHSPYYISDLTLSYPVIIGEDIPLTELPEDPDIEIGYIPVDLVEPYVVTNDQIEINTRLVDDGQEITAIKRVDINYKYLIG